MSFTYASRTVAGIRIIGLQGTRGLGVYRLLFSTEITTPVWQEADGSASLSDVRAEVFVGRLGQEQIFVGYAEPETPLVIETGPHPQERTLLFQLSLTDSQLFQLEKFRNGSGLAFKLCFRGYTKGTRGGYSACEELKFEATLSDWTRILQQTGYADVLVVGIELPSSVGERLGPARDLVLKAHAELIAGQYDAAIARCRNAIESVRAALGENDQVSAAVEKFCGRPRRDMAKIEREWLVSEAARHYAHPAHHVDRNGKPEWYSRSDATFMLALAAAVVSCATGRAIEQDSES